MMNYPKISIITITFNSEKTLRSTIESVVSQNYPNLEYIIIDGGSSDGTMDIVEGYRCKISRVVSEPDNGISDAFNKGIGLATGEIVGIINSDDMLMPDALLTVAAQFSSEVDVVRGNTIILDDLSGTMLSTRPTMEFPITKMIKSVCHQSTFITKKAYKKYGLYRTDFKYMMDVDLLHRFYSSGLRFIYIDKDLAVFRLGGVTSNDWRKKIPEFRLLLKSHKCSRIYIEYRVYLFALYNIVKQLLYFIIGPESARKIRYRK